MVNKSPTDGTTQKNWNEYYIKQIIVSKRQNFTKLAKSQFQNL